MASSRQFEMQHIQKRSELRQISSGPAPNSTATELTKTDIQQLDKVYVSLSAEHSVQVNLLSRLFGKDLSITKLDIPAPPQAQPASRIETAAPPPQETALVFTQNYHYEFESTAFEASGSLTLSDGTETHFSYQMAYTREFETYSEQLVTEQRLHDPLVINFSDQPLSVSSDTIAFDLNMDGTLDDMPTLSAQSGFIALDKNNNGIIDDGSELIGAETGNGFFELSQYDDNNDGYINNKDQVFSQLLVWQPGTNQPLTKLSDTKVDTLALQSVSTEFSFTDNNNQRLGQMRQSGIYANQDGTVGGLHQIDLVV